jgi:hypothetical protein
MRISLDLPDALVKQITLRALRDGRKLKDIDLLRKGLAVDESARSMAPHAVGKDKSTGLPVVHCQHAASSDADLTPERVAEILAAHEAE